MRHSVDAHVSDQPAWFAAGQGQTIIVMLEIVELWLCCWTKPNGAPGNCDLVIGIVIVMNRWPRPNGLPLEDVELHWR
jgi:hypothetical protein